MANIAATTSRRLKFLRWTDFLKFEHFKKVLLEVPDDVRFMGIEQDILTASHYVFLEHPSFDEVSDGGIIPEYKVTLTNPTKSAKTCTCGAGAVGSTGHASWCDAI